MIWRTFIQSFKWVFSYLGTLLHKRHLRMHSHGNQIYTISSWHMNIITETSVNVVNLWRSVPGTYRYPARKVQRFQVFFEEILSSCSCPHSYLHRSRHQLDSKIIKRRMCSVAFGNFNFGSLLRHIKVFLVLLPLADKTAWTVVYPL